MKNLIIENMKLGVLGTNCYMAIRTDTKEALIVDPASDAEILIKKMDALRAVPVAVLLTHAHFDHIGAVDDLVRILSQDESVTGKKLPVYILEEEAPYLTDPDYNVSRFMHSRVTAHADHLLHDGQTLHLAGFEIRVIHTPGHTPGSVCYYFPQEHVLFSGDTLFFRSVGRTDFPGGNMSAMHASLHEKLFLLPDDVIVYPGHDRYTTIGDEKKYNPF